MASSSAARTGKRLILACDGTWLDSDNGFKRDSFLPFVDTGHLAVPSNVTRIVRAIKPVTDDGTHQITYYQAGIGSANNWIDHYWGGTTGAGISEHIREGYAFIAENYLPGDEIFLLGFSRGAFTARSIAGFIAKIGILTRRGMDNFYPVFTDWENQVKPHYKSQWPNLPFPNKPSARDPAYFQELVNHNLVHNQIPNIRAVGVWETVGSLGIPQVIWPHPTEYSFTDSEVAANVEYAFQALGLDEHRAPYRPTVWEHPQGPNQLRQLKQCWFPGVHTNIGGGYDDAADSNITLTWMISQLSPYLEFDLTYIDYLHKLQTRYYIEQGKASQPWGLGMLQDSSSGLRMLAGSKVRTPGQYNKTDPETGKETKIPMQDTCEHIHSSVRVRIALHGKGVGGHGTYDPKALKNWTMAYTGEGDGIDIKMRSNPQSTGYEWLSDSNKTGQKILKEDELSEIERRLYVDVDDGVVHE